MGFAETAEAIGGIASGVSGVGSLVTGIIGAANEEKWNKKNFEFQQEELAYEKDLQKQIFAREDNAMQRKVADLRASGLNPVLAVNGGGSGTGTPIHVGAPQRQATNVQGIQRGAENVEASMRGMADISKTASEIEYVEQQKKKEKAQEQFIRAQTNKELWDSLYWQSRNLPTNPGTLAQTGNVIVGAGKQAWQNISQWWMKKRQEGHDFSAEDVNKAIKWQEDFNKKFPLEPIPPGTGLLIPKSAQRQP